MFVFCLGFPPTEELLYFSLIWRRQYCRWTASNFDLYSVPMGTEHLEFVCVLHLLWHKRSVYIVIFKDQWHEHPLSSVWQLSWITCFNDLGLSMLGFNTFTQTLSSTAPPLRHDCMIVSLSNIPIFMNCIFIVYKFCSFLHWIVHFKHGLGKAYGKWNYINKTEQARRLRIFFN